ncbi:MAG: hypothetical protein PHC56_06975, partial [Herbinix sp.]|nr:hypothetical protein [Herbinix sp.]
MEFPGRLIAGFLVVVLLLIFPLQYIGGLNNDSIDALIDNRTQQFSHAIREKGYLDKQMYEEYVSFLDTTEEMYDIELRDIRPVKGEEYSLETNLRPIRTSSFKKLSHNEIQSYAAHTHTADCYADDLHVCNGTDCEYENDVQKIIIGAGQRAYDNNLYMYYSYDGQTWNNFPNNSSAGYEFRKLTYMNGQFVIIGTWGHISVSSDGINWIDISSNFNVSGIPSDLTMRNDPFDIIDIVHVGNGVYYASSSAEKPTGYANPYSITKGVLLRSTDLINWEYVESFDQYIRGLSITKVGTKKILLGFSPGYYNSSFSYGRFNWEINENGTLANRTYSSLSDGENYSQAGDYTVAASSGRGYQVPGVYSTSYYSYFYSHRDYDFRYGNGIYLGFGSLENNYYTSVLIRGTSLSNMERVTNHNIDDISAVRNKMVFFDDRFIVAGSKETGPGSYSYYTYTSTDGISWTKRYAPVSFSHFACNAEGGSGEIDKGPCLKEGKYYDVNGVEIQPICNKVVSSIRAKHPAQTVKKGQAINTTAIATYLDGHEGEVNCTSNFIANQIGNQTVTLTYSGLVGNAKTAGTRTCTVNITVIPIRKLTSIAVFPEYQDIQRYSLPALTVRANYDDGTSKLLNSLEYNISGFNDANIALQSVVVTYAEGEITRSATVIVKVSALLKECPRCNQIYELNADDTDQGCPYCRELIIGIEVNPIYVEVTQGEELPITVKGIYNDGSSEE